MSNKELLINHWKKNNIITDKKAIQAFQSVPREEFIPDEYIEKAYSDYPLPILQGQTISQPTTVMLMTQALNLKEGNKVLEIGSGSGYQAAIIAKIIGKKGKTITTEIIPELYHYAKNNLERLKTANIKIILSDGSLGYEKEAPYDMIIITAACPSIPEPLISQLKEGGIILAPVGDRFNQQMIRAVKKQDKLKKEYLGDFVFVPLTGKHGFD